MTLTFAVKWTSDIDAGMVCGVHRSGFVPATVINGRSGIVPNDVDSAHDIAMDRDGLA